MTPVSRPLRGGGSPNYKTQGTFPGWFGIDGVCVVQEAWGTPGEGVQAAAGFSGMRLRRADRLRLDQDPEEGRPWQRGWGEGWGALSPEKWRVEGAEEGAGRRGADVCFHTRILT